MLVLMGEIQLTQSTSYQTNTLIYFFFQISQVLGHSLEMACLVEGNPQPNITWYHQENLLTTNQVRIKLILIKILLELSAENLRQKIFLRELSFKSLISVKNEAKLLVIFSRVEPLHLVYFKHNIKLNNLLIGQYFCSVHFSVYIVKSYHP